MTCKPKKTFTIFLSSARSRYERYRTGGTCREAEAAAETSGSVVPKLAIVEVTDPEDASVNTPTTPCTLFLVLLGNEPGCKNLRRYTVAKKSAQRVATARAAAAHYRGMIVVLHRVSHVDKAEFVAPPQSVECPLQRGLMGVTSCVLGDVIFRRVYGDADVSRGIAVPLVRAVATVLEDDVLSLPQELLHFTEVKYSVVSFNFNVCRDRDGALEFTGLGSKLLFGVVAWVPLPHLGRHGVPRAGGEI